MRDQSEPEIVFLNDRDPQEHPDYRAPELVLEDDAINETSQPAPVLERAPRVVRERAPRRRRPSIKTMVRLAGVGLAIYGGSQIVEGCLSEGGSHMEARGEVEETRVTIYENAPLELAGIDSDLSLEMTAGYDRSNRILGVDVDLNPINNMYEFKQEGLTTHTEATLIAQKMEVAEVEDEDGNDIIRVTFDGLMDLSKASIDWSQEEFAGADITWSSHSVGNDTKDKIDNDALEIFQSSAEVAAACGVMDEDVKPLLTRGVKKFLTIANPALVESGKPIHVVINGLDAKTEKLYVDAVKGLQDTVREIGEDYDGPNDRFDVDISQILDCEQQDIKIVEPEAVRE